MIAGLVGLGAVYWALKDKGATTPPATPNNPPQAVPTDEDSYRVEKVGAGDQNNIYLIQMRSGVLYDDGRDTRQWSDSGFIRGDFPTGFVSASARVGGTISFEINEIYYENVIVYKTKEDAIEADKDKETTPDSPVKPEEPKEEPVQPTLPVQPSIPSFGSGIGSFPSFGGGY